MSAIKVVELTETINAAKNNDFEGALTIVQSDRGEVIMNEIRAVVQIAIDEENRLLDERINKYEGYISISRILSVSGLLVALCLLIIVYRRGYVLLNTSIKQFIEYRDARDDELIQAREKAEAGKEAKSQFLASMSHKIRTPMTGVVGLTEMLAKTKLYKAQEDIVDSMRSTNRVLNTVINDVLDYSRIEVGKLRIEKLPFGLRGTIEEVVSTFHPSAVEKGIDFDTSFADDAPDYVMGDPTRVRQVLFNLVGNAIKFTDHGQVHIHVTSTHDDHVEFRVTDTGKGIAEEHIGDLFQPFEQADNTVSRKYGGTGLGLAICKNLVELMEGEISVSSNKGVGSTFRFRIPLSVADRPTKSEQVSGKPNDNELRPMNILVAEDVDINQVIIESILTDAGHSCSCANDGEQSVNAVQQEEFDLVLMDIRMPNIDGIEAFKRIRAIDSLRCHLPIVALTADVAEDQISSFLKIGFDGVASKPIDSDKLFAIISQAMQGTRLEPASKPF